MAILLIEKGKGEVVTAPVIRSEIGGGRVQISGRMSTVEANDVALLLRAGSLAAPMEIIEERTVGPCSARRTSRRASTRRCAASPPSSLFMIVYYLAVRRVLGARAVRQPAVPGRAAVAAAGDADAARHRRHRADAGHGDRRQRADQRAHPRGTAQRRHAAGGDPRRLRARLRHHPRLERHHADRRPGAAHLRLRAGARLRRGALPGHPHLDLHLGGGEPRAWSTSSTARAASSSAWRSATRPGSKRGGRRWNSSRSATTSRSCAMRWCSTSSRSSPSCSRSSSSPPRACTSRSNSPAAR